MPSEYNIEKYDNTDHHELENPLNPIQKKTSYQDLITDAIGDFGRAQLFIILTCKLPLITSSWSMLMMSFAGASPDWWNVVDTFNKTSNISSTLHHKRQCPHAGNIVFDHSDYSNTIVTEWNLVCSEDWIPSTIASIQMAGVMLGGGVAGPLGDYLGRRKTMLMMYSLNTVVIFVQAFSPNWYMVAVCAFFIGFALGGFLVVNGMMQAEFVGTQYRTVISIFSVWGFGVIIFGFMFKLIPNWRHLCIATAVVSIPILILLWLLPESIRWLFGHGKFVEAKQVLRKLANRNNLPEPDLANIDKLIENELLLEEQQKKVYTYIDLFRNKTLAKNAIILGIMWFTASFGYYGLTLGVSKLNGDIAWNMIIMGVGDTFGFSLVWLLSKFFARRYTTLIFTLLTGICSFGITIAYCTLEEPRFQVYMNVLALFSRFFLALAWGSIDFFTIESFPTVIRSVAYGFVSVISRFGGILGAQNNALMLISKHLPFTINGVLGIGCGLLCLLLEETYHSPLEDHIKEESNSLRLSTLKATDEESVENSK